VKVDRISQFVYAVLKRYSTVFEVHAFWIVPLCQVVMVVAQAVLMLVGASSQKHGDASRTNNKDV
jgi:hypothetical protein